MHIIYGDEEKYLKYYMESICLLGHLQISAIRNIAQYKGQGAEYISCSFDPNDEDYKEGYVTLYFWKPAVEQDTIVYVKNQKFYEYLLKVCTEAIENNPLLKNDLENSLNTIQIELNLN